MNQTIFSREELEQIERAVEKLEARFPLELVPVFTERSAVYYISRFRALLIAVISSFMLIFGLNEFTSFEWLPLYFLLLIGGLWITIVLMVCEFTPFINRFLIGKRRLREVTAAKARQEYLNQEVYSNPHRVGVMVFVSFFEHQFSILCDKKGASFFGEEEWLAISKELVDAMRKGNPCEAIEHCIQEIEKVMEQEVEESNDLPPSILTNNLRFD